uniref:Uncharacterized protein n=1 Tax=Rhizophora mucronata TaxID=61149 RepID=A0A2P2PY96_RHIMU
MVRQIKIEK